MISKKKHKRHQHEDAARNLKNRSEIVNWTIRTLTAPADFANI